MSRFASARYPPSSSERSGSSNRCRMSTPYFFGEIRRAHAAELQLQDELANEPLFLVGPVRAAQGKRPLADFRAVGLPLVEVLHVDAVDVAERRHAEAGQIGALPQTIAIDELRALGILHRGVRAADRVAGLLQRVERLVDPAALGRPARHVLLEAAGALQHVAADRRVERQLHLVDGDAVGRELDRFLDAALPVLLGLAEHARDEVDVDLRKPERLRKLIGAEESPPIGARGRSARECDRRSSRCRG